MSACHKLKMELTVILLVYTLGLTQLCNSCKYLSLCCFMVLFCFHFKWILLKKILPIFIPWLGCHIDGFVQESWIWHWSYVFLALTHPYDITKPWWVVLVWNLLIHIACLSMRTCESVSFNKKQHCLRNSYVAGKYSLWCIESTRIITMTS